MDMTSRPIVKIVPIPSLTDGGVFYKIEIPEQKSLLNEEQAQEFITYLQRAIDVVKEANKSV